MFELKYFAKIDRYEREERNDSDPRPLPPFDINVLGTGGVLGGATRRFTRWFFLFAFWVLRAVWPVAVIGRLVIVSRYDDVREVLAKPLHFRVPFGPEMRALTGGADFLLGQDGPEHDAQREILEAVVLKSDAPGILDNTRTITELLLKNSGGRIDVMQDLLGRVFTETCSDYFGLDLDEPDAFADRTMSVSALIFADPFGNEETRKLALNGAVRIRWLIDRAIDRAQVAPRAGTVIDRLVQYRRADGTPIDKPQIRAMALGTIIGLIPTNTLGAGRMIEELHRRGMLQSLIGAASAAEKARTAGDTDAAKRHRDELKKMLVEAARLNPALFPGQFRHVPKATTVAGKPVPAGSVMVVGTMSALRDSRKFANAGAFEPGRELDPALMFGEGSHVCLGAHLAMEQITDTLLRRTGNLVDGLRSTTALNDRHRSVVIVPIAGFSSYIGVLHREEQDRTEQRILWRASQKSLGENFVAVVFDGPAALFQFADYRDDVNGQRVRDLARTLSLTPAST